MTHNNISGKVMTLSKTTNNTSMSAFITSNQHGSASSGQCNQSRKENKRHSDWKERSKTVCM